MSTWNMPPGVSTADIPGQDDLGAIFAQRRQHATAAYAVHLIPYAEYLLRMREIDADEAKVDADAEVLVDSLDLGPWRLPS